MLKDKFIKVIFCICLSIFFVLPINLFVGEVSAVSEALVDKTKSGEIPKSLLPQLIETLGGTNSEYHILEQSSIYTSTTPGHGIVTTFHKDQVKFERGENIIGMRLVSTQENITPIKVSDNKIEYQRGNITEWYVNSPYGMEQGFTLNKKPQEAENEVSISIGLDLSDGVKAVDRESGKSIKFVDSNDNHILNYSGLYAFDSSGKELPSNLRLKDNNIIEISVDDRNAQYPITIDPFVQSQRVTAADLTSGAGDDFAWSVSIDGDRAIVGIPAWDGSASGQGAVIIYERNGSGVWVATPTLFSPVTGSNNDFGMAVSISGDWALIGEPDADQSFTNDGTAHFFQRVSGVWIHRSTVSHVFNDLAESFGFSVSISGDRAIVGDPLYGSGGVNNPGAVFVYHRSGSNWNASPSNPILPGDSDRNDVFGTSVSISGDWFIAGAPGDSMGAGFSTVVHGSVYFFQRTGITTWSERQKVIGETDSDFGESVAIDGTIAIAGAPGDTVIGGSSIDAGSVYIFERSGTDWTIGSAIPDITTTETRITASNQAAGDKFGTSVSIFGDMIVIGARSKDVSIGGDGSAYIYQRTAPGVWGNEDEVFASDPSLNAFFGQSVSISGDTLLIGSPQADDVAAEQGAGYFFEVGAMLTIVKETNPNGATGFGFTGTGFPTTCGLNGSFTLDDNESSGTSFIDCNVLPGSYTVQETNPNGHSLVNLNCVGTNNFTETSDSVTVNLIEEDMVVCTFTNTINRTLSVTINGGGTVTSNPAGINCGSDCTEDYVAGTSITLTPTPDAGYRFDRWNLTGDCSDGSVTMTGNRNCNAHFLQVFPLTLLLTGPGTGSVTSSPAGIDCGTDCTEEYDPGTVVTFTPVADADSYFSRYTGVSGADCETGTVTVNSAMTCRARFNLKPILTIEKSGNGSGTVTASPGGIDCGATCSAAFNPRTSVVMTATAGPNSDFVGFTGDGCTTGTVTTTTTDTTCTAEFALKQRTLSTTVVGGGTITSTPAGIDCGSDCTEEYDHGTVVTLTPTPDTGFRFDRWNLTGDCSDGSVTMNNNRNCSAHFQATSVLTVTKAGTGTGTVTSAPAGINCGSDCTEVYDNGSVVALTAVAGSDSDFKGFEDVSGASCTSGSITLNGDTTCRARFDLEPILTVTKTGPGIVTSTPAGINCGTDCTEEYDFGASVTLTATATEPYYELRSWGGACSSAGSNPTATVTMSESLTCTALFALEQRTLRVNIFEGSGTLITNPAGINCGSGGSDCTEEYDFGTRVEIIPVPDPGYVFASVVGSDFIPCALLTGAGREMTRDFTCNISFIPSHPLRVNIIGDGTVTSSPPGTDCGSDCEEHPVGIDVTLTAVPESNQEFVSWDGACSAAGSNTSATVSMDSAQTCTAIFDDGQPEPPLLEPELSSLIPGTVGSNTLTSINHSPGEEVLFIYGFNEGLTSADGICSGLELGVVDYRNLQTAIADESGQITIDVNIPAGAVGVTVKMQSVDLNSCLSSNVVTQTLEAVDPGLIEVPVLESLVPGTVGLNTLTSTNHTPGGQVKFIYGFNEQVTSANDICSGLQLGIGNHVNLPTVFADQFGNATLDVNVPQNAAGLTVKIQSVDLSYCVPSNITTETF